MIQAPTRIRKPDRRGGAEVNPEPSLFLASSLYSIGRSRPELQLRDGPRRASEHRQSVRLWTELELPRGEIQFFGKVKHSMLDTDQCTLA
jgi:hypothetical protein